MSVMWVLRVLEVVLYFSTIAEFWLSLENLKFSINLLYQADLEDHFWMNYQNSDLQLEDKMKSVGFTELKLEDRL
jgi:hypothetical protein